MATFVSRLGFLTVISLGLLAQASCGDTTVAPVPDGAAGASGASGEGGAGEGGADQGGPTSLLGSACETDADCGVEGLQCLTADSEFAPGIGSAARGVCTVACQDDAGCRRFERGAWCIGFANDPAEPGYCFQNCILGEEQQGSAKCQGRKDFACQPMDLGYPEDHVCEEDPCGPGETCVDQRCTIITCLPQCTSDAECSEGRFCNVQLGTCVAEPQPPSDLGKDCAIRGTERQCLGTCVMLFDELEVSIASYCTENCVLGYPCGNGRGACVGLDHDFDASTGDIGYCMEACDCDDDCSTTGFACDPAGPSLGRPGLCGPRFGADGSAIETLACGAEG